jgi:hypothetical protein
MDIGTGRSLFLVSERGSSNACAREEGEDATQKKRMRNTN